MESGEGPSDNKCVRAALNRQFMLHTQLSILPENTNLNNCFLESLLETIKGEYLVRKTTNSEQMVYAVI